MADTKKTEKKFSTYKGRPLVRCNDEIYYGSMEEPYVIRMQIKSKKCFFTNTALLRCIFATQKVSTDVFLQKTLLKCKMEARKMNRGCDV